MKTYICLNASYFSPVKYYFNLIMHHIVPYSMEVDLICFNSYTWWRCNWSNAVILSKLNRDTRRFGRWTNVIKKVTYVPERSLLTFSYIEWSVSNVELFAARVACQTWGDSLRRLADISVGGFNILRPRQNGRHFAADIFKRFFLQWKYVNFE